MLMLRVKVAIEGGRGGQAGLVEDGRGVFDGVWGGCSNKIDASPLYSRGIQSLSYLVSHGTKALESLYERISW